jgi:succinate-semialdehyde dehydrogenase / glutarate-semialdehyde dehydrogenase
LPYRSVNPATGKVLKTFPEHTDEQMWSALAQSDKAFRTWAARPFSERSRIIARSAQILLEQKEELARLATLEMGKRIAESRGEVELSASIMQYFADKAEAFLAPKKLDSAMGDARFEYSPLGVLLSIQPWNYPYYQLARFAGPHLMSGNVILLKHAPVVPQCALAFEQVLREAGVPEGVYTNLFLNNDQSGALIDDPRVKGIALTGSERAGEALASRAGKNLKKSTMELGGSDAFVVLDDADLDHTVEMAVLGRFGNNGQTCIGAKRFIIVKSMLDKFLPRFIAAAKKLKLGDPLDETVTLGPLSSDAALQLILRQIQEATSHGAQIALGGHRAGEVGAFLEPTILTNVNSDNPAYKLGVWPRRIRLHFGHRKREADGESYGNGHGLHQLSRCQRSGSAFRRSQALRLWQGTFQPWPGRVCEQEADPRSKRALVSSQRSETGPLSCMSVLMQSAPC